MNVVDSTGLAFFLPTSLRRGHCECSRFKQFGFPTSLRRGHCEYSRFKQFGFPTSLRRGHYEYSRFNRASIPMVILFTDRHISLKTLGSTSSLKEETFPFPVQMSIAPPGRSIF